jgi:hypothetical protein
LDFADTVTETTKRLAPEYVRLTGKKSTRRR